MRERVKKMPGYPRVEQGGIFLRRTSCISRARAGSKRSISEHLDFSENSCYPIENPNIEILNSKQYRNSKKQISKRRVWDLRL